MNKLKKIHRKDIEDIIALTPMQEGMLFHYLKDSENDCYFEQLSLEVSGEIDVEIFEKAWNVVIETNEMLRTVFQWEKLEKPAQFILKKHQIQPVYYDFLDRDVSEKESLIGESEEKIWIEKIKVKERKEKFDLREVPFRVTLCRFNPGRYEMIISNHHILYDGWSNGIILKEFFEAYDQLCKGNTFVPPVKVKFKEFIKWIQERDTVGQEKFWQEYLKGFDTRTGLPIRSKSNESRIKIAAGNYNCGFSRVVSEKVERFLKKHKLTMASLLYGVWGLLSQRHNNYGDVVFGTIVSGRSAKIAGIEDMVGLFINTLPLRVHSPADERIVNLLNRVDSMLMSREEYESTPLVDINGYSEIDDKNELFDSLVVLENYPIYDRLQEQKSTLVVQSYSMVEMTHYALTLQITLANGIELSFNYNRDLLEESIIVKLAHDFMNVTRDIINHPGRMVSEIDILSNDEKNQILYEFNDTKKEYLKDKTISELFEEQAVKVVNRIAVVYQDNQLNYGELNDKANRLAVHLKRKGVTGDKVVGVLVERSLEMIIGILAILKANSSYLPIDTGYPLERIRYILKDSMLKWVLARGSLGNQLGNIPGVEVLDLLDQTLYRAEETYPAAVNSPAHLAYVIYTSGSTGLPKGVMIEHQSVTNLLFALDNEYPFLESDTYLLKTSYVFDVSVTELFGWILGRGRLAIIGQNEGKDSHEILKAIEKFFITHINFVPSMFKVFIELLNPENIEKLSPLKYIFLAGEVLLPHLVNQFRRLNSIIILENIYGPTEAAVYASKYSLSQWKNSDHIPIGTPISNIKLYILDRYDRLQPIGITGELCIEGAGLGRGYLNRPELTAEKFVERVRSASDRYRWENNEKLLRGVQGGGFLEKSPPGRRRQKIYRTGDLARWLPDGNVEFLGRKDHQVKIRGYRIELGEIENKISNYHDHKIKDVVVVDREDKNGDKYLCAYIVSSPRRAFDKTPFIAAALREYLSKELPDYMIPFYFVQLDELPLTASGKVNRKALPQPGPEAKEEEYAAPRGEIEETLGMLFRQVLGVDSIGRNADFFRWGGHSLKATILVSRVCKAFNIDFPLNKLFKAPTIKGIARYIEKSRKHLYKDIIIVEKKEYYPLSSAQKRLFFLDRFEDIGTSYNMPAVIRIKGRPEVEHYERAFHQLTARHETLRTSFELVDHIPVQRIHHRIDVKIKYYDPGDAFGGESPPEEIMNHFIRPFDLVRAPLFRVGLVSLTESDYMLLFDMHHIISDGTSMGNLIRDFEGFYNGEKLVPLKLQYKDFATWQNTLLETGILKNQEDYWLDHYPGEIPRLNLPADYPRPAVFAFTGERYKFWLNPEGTIRFREFSLNYGVTLFMNFLAAFNVLLHRYTSQSDIIVGTSIAGRRHADLQDIIGMFVNALAMRNYPQGEQYYPEFLKEVKNVCLKAYENQDVQFEALVEKLDPERDPSRNPIFDVCLVAQNFEQLKSEINDVNLDPFGYGNKTTKFDLTLFVYESRDEIIFDLEYYSEVFKRETIERFASHFVNIIEQLTENPGIRLADIEMLKEEEKQVLIDDLNQTACGYPTDKTIYQLFTDETGKSPDKTAVIYRNESLSYRYLDEKTNQLANYLYYEKHTRRDNRIGILMDNSPGLIIAILGILKAGGSYVPLDQAAPEERLKNIIHDASVGVVISQRRYIGILDRLQWECKPFHTFLCLDSIDIYSEEETEESGLMDEELWNYVGETAVDEITGGGWNTGYTDEPFTKKEMEEYGDNIVKKLEPILYKNMRVLEIGCASGISMYRIAPKVAFYYGTDLSRVMIEKNRERVRSEGHRNIALASLPAHQIDRLGEKNFDLIVLNSVIQSFPGHNYLRKVMRKSVNLLADKGYLYIGDIMDLDLKADLVQDMIDFKRANPGKNYNTKTDWSTELFVSRSFFKDQQADIPGILDVEITDKIFTIENELTKFRYDVLVRVYKRHTEIDKNKTKLKFQHDITDIQPYSTRQPGAGVRPGDTAYVIYTSGTSGKPKGVMIEHQSLVNYVLWGIKEYIDDKADNYYFPLYTSTAFDLTVTSIFLPLISGNTIAVYDYDGDKNRFPLQKILEEASVDIIKATPSHLKVLRLSQDIAGENVRLKKFIVGGEELETHLARDIYNRFPGGLEIYNEYGPTEATVGCMIYRFDHERDKRKGVSIGLPAANVKIYILDKYLNPVPVNSVGEIYIGGDALARGYVNLPGLTAEKFLKNPFFPGGRIYATGDMACRMADGNIEFLGRLDEQVKIRGYRIEMKEIENRLLEHDDIDNALVQAKSDQWGDSYLCTYIVSDKGMEIEMSEIKEFLSLKLPDYMIPAYFSQIDKIPLTANGKVDRKALPHPEIKAGDGYIAPRNEKEQRLVKIWSEVLGIEKDIISIDSNFFELGGHSLKATVLTSKIHKEFDIKVPLAEIFKTPTTRGLSEYIKQAAADVYKAIEVAESKEYYALSSAQKRLYVLQQMEKNYIGYNELAVLELEGKLDKERFAETFRKLIERHESLRTSFTLIEDEPVQRIHRINSKFRITNYKQIPNPKSQITNTIKNFVRPFDLTQAPLLRVGLVEPSPAAPPSHQGESPGSRYILMLDIHHIITDGISQGIFIKDFMSLYERENLPEPRIQYKDFARWQNREKHKEAIKRQEVYWLGEFNDEIPVLNLPVDFVRPPVQGFEGSSVDIKFNPEKTTALKKLAREEDATLFMVLLAIYNIFLSKISSQENIITGTPVSGRRHSDLQPVVGMFVNTLALRNTPNGNQSFREFLRQLRERTLEAFENQDYQFEDLVEHTAVHRDASRNPIFDTMFALQNQEMSPLEIPALKLKPHRFETSISKFDLALQVSETEKHLHLIFEYSTKLFKKETIERFTRYFKNIISCISERPDKKISGIELLLETEKKQLLYDFNDTQTEYPKDKTIRELFVGQVENRPDNIALVYEDKQLTYRELYEKVNRLAVALREKGINPGVIAAVMMERSIEMIVGIFAVLKAGGAYLPIEPDYPPERIKYILEDSSAKLLLSLEPAAGIIGNNCEILSLKDMDVDINLSAGSVGEFKISNNSADLAYVIYTSGSTGKPKGVIVEHGNLINILFTLFVRYPFSKKDIYLLKTSFLFDVSVGELFGWFIGGGKLAILKGGGDKDPQLILDTIAAAHITHINFVPSMFHAFVSILNRLNISKLSYLKYIFLAGEALGKELIEMFNGFNTTVVLENLYGPTEATIYASGYSLQDWNGHDRIPIGKPLENAKIYILNNYDHLQPIGIPGELCIAGAGVARGYLNKPQLTAEKFCLRRPKTLFEKNAPVRETSAKNFLSEGTRGLAPLLYRTGDLARWLPDGNIEFLGRIDHQVKIRGNRIELGEIESRLLNYPGLKEVVVLVREEVRDDKYICAYFVSDSEYRISELRDYLSMDLPDYMIPSYFMRLEKIPLTHSGKVDRGALPRPELKVGESYTAPGDEIEKKLVEIWSGVLGIEKEKIGINDNFFHLGGHSLKATVLAARVHREINVNMTLTDVFKTPSIIGMARYIRNKEKSVFVLIKPIEKKEHYELSSSQKRLYVLQQMKAEAVAYNMPLVLMSEGNIDKGKLEKAFRQLIKRYEAFRTSFTSIDGTIVQIIHKDVNFHIEYEGMDSVCLHDETRIRRIIKEFIRPFSLDCAPLLRVMLIRLSGKEHLLLVDIHHIISDGMSISIIVKDFIDLYGEKELLLLRIQYKDFAEWQNILLESGALKAQEKYWLDIFNGPLPVLNLNPNSLRPPVQNFVGETTAFETDRGLTGKIKKMVSQTETTLYIMLFSVFNILLAKYTDQEDIIIGSPIAGRSRQDLDGTVGVFVNTIAMRNFLDGDKSFEVFLKEVKGNVLKAFANQDYPFEKLVTKLNIPMDASRNPLFEVVFALNNIDSEELAVEDSKFYSYEFENKISRFDLVMHAAESRERIQLKLEYATALFNQSNAQLILKHYVEILNQVLENISIELKDIKISHDFIIPKSNTYKKKQLDFSF